MTAGTKDSPFTADELKRKQQLLNAWTEGVLHAHMVYTGRQLGLYRAMADGAPVTADDLAERAGLNARFVLEWLRAQAAAGVLDYLGEGSFALPAACVPLLVDDESLTSLGSWFDGLAFSTRIWAKAPEAFRTGIGYSWDDRGREAPAVFEGAFRNWYRQVLVQRALPALDGAVAALNAGAVAADVGCGAGLALIEMARAFPASDFHGYDSSAHAIARANLNRDAAGLANLHFHVVPGDPLPTDGSIDLVTAFDCLHDMTRPAEVVAAIRKAIGQEGWWLIADIRSLPTFEENMREHPMAARMYATSVAGCLQTGMSEPGGAGLGTLGLPEPKMRDLVAAAGFTRFRTLDLPSPINAYYEVRP